MVVVGRAKSFACLFIMTVWVTIAIYSRTIHEQVAIDRVVRDLYPFCEPTEVRTSLGIQPWGKNLLAFSRPLGGCGLVGHVLDRRRAGLSDDPSLRGRPVSVRGLRSLDLLSLGHCHVTSSQEVL